MAQRVGGLSQKEVDIQMMLASDVHLGTKNCDLQRERYVFKRRTDGIFIINLGKTWKKLQLATRVIVAIEHPQNIIVQSARPYGQRAILKFAQYTGAHAIAGRHTPGTFANQLHTSFNEPRLLILTDPRTDHQPIREAALGNIPAIAFCDTDSPMKRLGKDSQLCKAQIRSMHFCSTCWIRLSKGFPIQNAFKKQQRLLNKGSLTLLNAKTIKKYPF